MDKLSKTQDFYIVDDNNRKIVIDPVNLHFEFGGEGLIYKVKSDIIKLYKEDDFLSKNNYAAKLKALKRLDPSYICYPTSIVTNKKGEEVGVHMPFIAGTTLHEAQSNVFWSSHNLKLKHALKIISKLWDITEHAHEQGFITTDANLLNWMIDPKKKFRVTAIDVEAWRHDQWKPNKMSPSIQDFTETTQFTEETDWYAWAVVSFCLITGAHPYSGNVRGYKPGDTETRAKDKVSLFSPKVKKINRNVRLDMPEKLKKYFISVFEDGNRDKPTKDLISDKVLTRAIAPIASPTTTQNSTAIKFDLVDASQKWKHCIGGIVISDSNFMVLPFGEERSLTKGEFVTRYQDSFLKFIRKNNKTVGMSTYDDQLLLKTPNVDLNSEWTRVINGRIFSFYQGKLRETTVFETQRGAQTADKTIGSFTNNELKAYESCFLRSHGDHSSLLVPYGDDRSITVKLPFDNSHRVLSASASKYFCKVECVDKNGQMWEYDINLAKSTTIFNKIDTRIGSITQLDNGVVVWVDQDNNVVIYSSKADQKTVLTSEYDITSLSQFRNKVYAIAENKLYRISS